MGTWGTGIYSNDTAEDVRDACKDIFAVYDVNEGCKILFQSFKELLEQDFIDNDCASFWYALSDWLWKHGMLTEFVKDKALSLLSSYAGIEEWEEANEPKNVLKRRKVLDDLKIQLQKEQPFLKKPKLHLVKPKHKPGDIIVFKATDFIDEWDSSWHIENLTIPYMFLDRSIADSSYENVNGYNAHGKFMAILCVGSNKVKHSEYLSEAFDEYSSYVWYDYLSEEKPCVAKLQLCGFLPMISCDLEDFNKHITKSISWIYHFSMFCESFKDDDYIVFESKIQDMNGEVMRFEQLFSGKYYSTDYHLGPDLRTMFSTAFGEKNRMDLLGKSIDNLLDAKTCNPELLSPAESDIAYKEFWKNVYRQRAEQGK